MSATTRRVDAQLLKALDHPLRVRLLDELVLRGEACPSELVAAVGSSLATVSRHMRLLRDLGCVELTRTEPRRGAVTHFYRATQLPFIEDEEWEALPVPLRRGMARLTFRSIFGEASAAGGVGGFDAGGMGVARVPLELDDAGQADLTEAVFALMRRAAAIQAESDERRGKHADAPVTRLVLMHYEVPASPATPSGEDGRRPHRGVSRRRLP